MSQFTREKQNSLSREVKTQNNRVRKNTLLANLDTSLNHTNKSYYPITLYSPEMSYSNSSEQSIITERTINTDQMRIRDSDKKRLISTVEGLEVQYNNLISQNGYQEKDHFSILNARLENLINKKKPQREWDSVSFGLKHVLAVNFIDEVTVSDIKQILNDSPEVPISTPSTPGPKINLNYDTADYKNDVAYQYNNKVTEHEAGLTTGDIGNKFRSKKLPYLEKKIKTGYLKFFDDRNHFGFMTLLTEPFGDVFVFGKEFAKANIDSKLISQASGNPDISFKFRVMYYLGRHGESKKAVNIH